ncbi:MAG: hypothetical protein K2X29_05455 [Candidatus Obscuribacterales bacterium]|nr:hypothetical protein [Candidatus Obscuribacterales bacterium]
MLDITFSFQSVCVFSDDTSIVSYINKQSPEVVIVITDKWQWAKATQWTDTMFAIESRIDLLITDRPISNVLQFLSMNMNNFDKIVGKDLDIDLMKKMGYITNNKDDWMVFNKTAKKRCCPNSDNAKRAING